jgi:hypothetical protein
MQQTISFSHTFESIKYLSDKQAINLQEDRRVVGSRCWLRMAKVVIFDLLDYWFYLF